MLPETASPTPFVIDVTAENFQSVLETSLTTPVLLDFWADWCGPCKQLGPILEKLAQEYQGGFILAKVNVDAEQALAGQFGIRSIPTVILVKDGQLVDGFPGVLPEGQLRQFLTQHGVVPGESVMEAAESVPETPEELLSRLREACAAQPEEASLKLDLALALARAGITDEAKTLIDALPANLGTDDRARNATVLINNASHLSQAPAREILEQQVAADPANLTARHLLGLRLLSEGQDEQALQQFLEMLRQQRDFQEGLPRKALIEAFNLITDAELVGRYRRQMAALLF